MEIIKISDKKVVEFYKSHPELNIVTMNLIFIDILEKLSSNLHTSVENTVSQQILGLVTDMRAEFKQFNTGLSTRLTDIKREYIDDVKQLMTNSELIIHDKITHSIERNLDSFVAKTTLAINDTIPSKNASALEDVVKKYTDRIISDTTALLSPEGKLNKRDGLQQLETSLNTMITNMQTLANTVNVSESKNASVIQSLNERMVAHKQSQDAVFSELGSFLNKYKNNSSVKGAISETELYHMLQQIEPYAEIVRCSGETATCDFRMRRLNASKPVILFESKDYAASVNTEEVAKFERDLQTQKCHGIFVSQNSPITFKENFHIDIINGIIHVYISNVKYDVNILKTAIDIVDHLDYALPNRSGESKKTELSVNVLNKDIELMRIECSSFAAKRLRIIDCVRSFSKDMLEQLDEIQLPNIRRITGAETGINGLPCTICNNFWGKNQSSLSAHKRKCAKEHGFVENAQTNDVEPPPPVTPPIVGDLPKVASPLRSEDLPKVTPPIIGDLPKVTPQIVGDLPTKIVRANRKIKTPL